jgi:hypothetical protein
MTGGRQPDGTYVTWVLTRDENVIRESTNRNEIVRIAQIARRFGARVSVFRTTTTTRQGGFA